MWWVYLASISFSCVNNPSSVCKVVETLYLLCKLIVVNSSPSICTKARPNCNKIAYVSPNILLEPIKFYTGMPVVAVTNSKSGSGGCLEGVSNVFQCCFQDVS